LIFKGMETIIRDMLNRTRKCRFKQAFLPEGWTCVHINTFIKEVTQEIEKRRKAEFIFKKTRRMK